MTHHENDYEELAQRAERGELAGVPGTIRRGADAADEGRALLLAATGAATLEDASRLALGRPRLDDERGPAPAPWKIRVPTALDARAREAAEREDVKLSVLVRRAVDAYTAIDPSTIESVDPATLTPKGVLELAQEHADQADIFTDRDDTVLAWWHQKTANTLRVFAELIQQQATHR